MRPPSGPRCAIRAALAIALATLLAGPVAPVGGQASPAPGAFPDAALVFPAPRVVLTDPMDTPGRWPEAETATYRIGVADGALAVDLLVPGQASWGWLTLDAASPVLRVGMRVTLAGPEAAGAILCGSVDAEGAPRFIGGGIASDGTWFAGRLGPAGLAVAARGPLAARPMAGAVPVELACGRSQDGSDRIRLEVAGTAVVELPLPGIGPFDRVAVYAARGTADGGAAFDEARIAAGDLLVPPMPGAAPDPAGLGTPAPPTPLPTASPAPSSDPEEAELWRHLPSAFAASCVRVETGATGDVLAGALCRPAGSVEIAEYYRYRDVATMNAAFEAAVPDGLKKGRCTSGPGRGTYTMDGEVAGRVACYRNPGTAGGVLIAWTTDALRILAFGVRQDGDHAALHAWWIDESGPFR